MKITICYIGRDNKNLFEQAEKEYLKRLKHYARIDLIQIQPKKYSSRFSKSDIQKAEEKLILSKIPTRSNVILLDEKGTNKGSIEFSKELQRFQNQNISPTFIVGGALGFSDEFKRQHTAISLSKMTFPHHMARVVLLEQLYRGFTILANEKYHNV